MSNSQPVCVGCNNIPSQIEEYVDMAEAAGLSPDDFVRQEEGTYNPENGHFACTDCYIRMGQPTEPGRGWVAP